MTKFATTLHAAHLLGYSCSEGKKGPACVVLRRVYGWTWSRRVALLERRCESVDAVYIIPDIEVLFPERTYWRGRSRNSSEFSCRVMWNRRCVCLAWILACTLVALYLAASGPHWNIPGATTTSGIVPQSGRRVGVTADLRKENNSAVATSDGVAGWSRCEEVFSVGAGGPLANVSEFLLQGIREAKSGGDPWKFDLDAYDRLSSSMPSLLPPRGENGSSGILGGTPDGARSIWVPWLPCRLHLYRPPEVRRCFQQRRKERMSNHIIFIGDSRTRRTFQAFGKLLGDMDVTYHLHDGSQLNWTIYNSRDSEKSHEMQFATSGLVPGFRLDFFFVSSFTENVSKEGDKHDATEIFAKLLRQFPSEKRLPLVIINTGTWDVVASNLDSLKGLDNFGSNIWDSAAVIHAMAKKMPMVFWVSDPYKTVRILPKQPATNDKLEWTTKTLLWRLRDSDVILWDSTLPLAHAYNRDCRVTENDPKGYGHLVGLQDWMCFDAVHMGFVALAFRAQVVLNYLCNGVEEREGVCCT